MVIHFKPGRHHCTFWGKLYLLWCALICRQVWVEFRPYSCYTLPGNDQQDWNKLVGYGGIRYSFKKKIRKTEHLYAWRYNSEKECFEIAEYWRKNWEFGFTVLLTLEPWQRQMLPLTNLNYGLPLGGYFGGNQTAPYEIKHILT